MYLQRSNIEQIFCSPEPCSDQKFCAVMEISGWAEGNLRWGLLGNKKNDFLSKNIKFSFFVVHKIKKDGSP